MPTLTVRYYAAARAAAGTSSELIDAVCVDDALAELCARHNDQFARVVKVSSLLLDGLHVDDGRTRLGSAAELDVLPPFAGG